jgi:hypothetical protein
MRHGQGVYIQEEGGRRKEEGGRRKEEILIAYAALLGSSSSGSHLHESPTSAIVSLAIGCVVAFTTGGEPASAQGRGFGPGGGRGAEAANEPRGVRVKTDQATPGYLLFAPLNSDTTYLIDNDTKGRVHASG